MKSLYLLRHAKSSWRNESLEDSERPLKPRGRRDCQLMAGKIAALPIQRVFVSPAQRSRETWQLIRESETALPEASVEPELYTFDHSKLLAWLRERPASDDQLLLVGHNPALLDLAEHLTLRKLINLPTCALVVMQLRIEYWDQVRGGCAEMKQFLRPSQLRDG